MTHQHGGRPGSMDHSYVNALANQGICARTGEPFNPTKGGSDDGGGCESDNLPSTEISKKEIKTKKLTTAYLIQKICMLLN